MTQSPAATNSASGTARTADVLDREIGQAILDGTRHTEAAGEGGQISERSG